MKFVLEPSLKLFCLIKVVITLWNQKDVRALMEKLYFPILPNGKEWQNVEDEVIGKVNETVIPGQLKEEIINLIKPIGFQIFKWLYYHRTHYFSIDNLPDKFYWTPLGLIDSKKTAEMLIKDDKLSIVNCYKLACIYCLENDIPKLWNKMPDCCKESILDKKYYSYDDYPNEASQQSIVIFWAEEANQEKWAKKASSYQSRFEFFARFGNKAATEYFYQKLSPQEINSALLSNAEFAVNADVFSFLLSKMTEKQQIEYFKCKPYEMQYFLAWPMQSFFVEVADHVWDFLDSDENYYFYLLFEIIDKIKYGYKDWNYLEIFENFWCKIKESYKRYIFSSTYTHLLVRLFRIKDKESVFQMLKLILQDATLIEKRKLIYHHKVLDICQTCICNDEWDLVRFFIHECLPSENEITKFKENFEKHITLRFSEDQFAWNKYKWNQFCHSNI